jgi:hypothetical protein
MRPLLFVASLTAAACFAAPGAGAGSGAADDAPQMNSISVKVAKPGDVVDIAGLGLSSKKVDELYLTDHKFDMKVKVVEQSENAIKFRVPPFAKPGRMQILVLTRSDESKGDDAKLLEQPLFLLIEEPSTEVVQVKTPPQAQETSAAPAKQDQHDKQQ